MSYIYTIPTTDGTATKLFGHRSFGAFGNSETVAGLTGVDSDGNDIFNSMGARLAYPDQTPSDCEDAYMAVTVIPKWSGSTHGKLSMKVLHSETG